MAVGGDRLNLTPKQRKTMRVIATQSASIIPDVEGSGRLHELAATQAVKTVKQ